MDQLYWSYHCKYSIELVQLVSKYRVPVEEIICVDDVIDELPDYLRCVPSIIIMEDNAISCIEGNKAFVYVEDFIRKNAQKNKPEYRGRGGDTATAEYYQSAQDIIKKKLEEKKTRPSKDDAIIPRDGKSEMQRDKDDYKKKIQEETDYYNNLRKNMNLTPEAREKAQEEDEEIVRVPKEERHKRPPPSPLPSPPPSPRQTERQPPPQLPPQIADTGSRRPVELDDKQREALESMRRKKSSGGGGNKKLRGKSLV